MKTLRSYVCGAWHEAGSGFASLVNPSTEEEIARIDEHWKNYIEYKNNYLAEAGHRLYRAASDE